METTLIKDFALIVSLLSTVISAYFALKYKTQKNSDENTEAATNFKTFKEFVHTELKELKDDIEKLNLNVGEFLKKEDAEGKYLTRKEHKLSYENLNMKIDLILDAVKNKTR